MHVNSLLSRTISQDRNQQHTQPMPRTRRVTQRRHTPSLRLEPSKPVRKHYTRDDLIAIEVLMQLSRGK
jgi:hypothetical protein